MNWRKGLDRILKILGVLWCLFVAVVYVIESSGRYGDWGDWPGFVAFAALGLVVVFALRYLARVIVWAFHWVVQGFKEPKEGPETQRLDLNAKQNYFTSDDNENQNFENDDDDMDWAKALPRIWYFIAAVGIVGSIILIAFIDR